MNQSKLEIYVGILKTLAQIGPSRLTDIEYKVKVDAFTLKEILEFLVGQNFVKRQMIKKQPIFAVTNRGMNVLKFFRVLVQEISDVEEI